MQRVAQVLIVLCLIVCLRASAPAQFEGIFETRNLTTNAEGQPEEFTMTMWIKPDRIRISSGSDSGAPGITMIYRADRRLVWMLNGEVRTYAEIPQEEWSQPPEPPDPGMRFRVRKTGKTAKILGFACSQVVITRGDERTELWGSRRLRPLQQTLADVLGDEPTSGQGEWAREVDRLGLFPLKSSTTLGGRVVEAQEVVRIEETRLDTGIFEIPAGYRKEDLNRLLEQGPPEY